jgi:hypothetical protein
VKEYSQLNDTVTTIMEDKRCRLFLAMRNGCIGFIDGTPSTAHAAINRVDAAATVHVVLESISSSFPFASYSNARWHTQLHQRSTAHTTIGTMAQCCRNVAAL